MLAAIVHNPNPRFVLSFKWGASMVDLNVDLMFKSGASLVVQWLRLCTRAQSLQSCPTPRNPMDRSPPGSSVCGILQARLLEWVAIASSRGVQYAHILKYFSYRQGPLNTECPQVLSSGGSPTSQGEEEAGLRCPLLLQVSFTPFCVPLLPCLSFPPAKLRETPLSAWEKE